MPGIVFESLGVTTVTGVGDGSFVLTGDGYEQFLERGIGDLIVVGDGYGDVILIVDPDIPPVGDGSLYVTGEGDGYEIGVGEGDMSFALAGESFGIINAVAGTTYGFAEGGFYLSGGGFEYVPASAYGLLMEQPPFIQSTYGAYFGEVNDGFLITDWSFADFIAVLRDQLVLNDQFSVLASLVGTIDDSLVLRDFVTFIAQVQINDTFDVADLTTAQLRVIGLIADQLVIADDQIPWMAAVHTIVAGIMFADEFRGGRDVTVSDAMAFADVLEAALAAVGTVASTLAINDEFETHFTLFALVDDSFALADDLQGNLALLAEIFDGFELGVRFTVGGDTYVGYSVNTKIAAVSEYENFPFNSLTLIGGKLYGAGPDGVYRMEGDDDEGAPIAARLRMGVTNFGTMLEKRVPYAYIGYTSDGELVLKTITMDSGFKKENWYTMKSRPEGAVAESRFDIAKGLRGVYWGFELVNKDGADFTLDTLQMYPLAINRRYSGR